MGDSPELPELIRRSLPRWRDDPYQRIAVDALLRIAFAAERAEAAIDALGAALAFFLEEPPHSLLYAAPRQQAEALASRLAALAEEIRKGTRALRELETYADQFDSVPP